MGAQPEVSRAWADGGEQSHLMSGQRPGRENATYIRIRYGPDASPGTRSGGPQVIICSDTERRNALAPLSDSFPKSWNARKEC